MCPSLVNDPKKQHIVYEGLNAADVNYVVDRLSYSFAKFEPMGRALKLQPLDLKELFQLIIQSSLRHSYVARDSITKRIIGGIICNDFKLLISQSTPKALNSRIEPIFNLLSSLEEKFIKYIYDNKIEESTCLYQYATYVDQEYERQGIATSLYNTSEQNALNSYFKYLVTISTGTISQHIRINKLNFKEIYSIEYKKFLFNNRDVFKSIENPYCMLLLKALNIR